MKPSERIAKRIARIGSGRRADASQKLINAAYAFWQACQEEGQYGAVQWLEDSRGNLLLFTRGEYRETLLKNIGSLFDEGRIHHFHRERIE